MQFTIHIAENIRRVVKGVPKSVLIQKQQPTTVRQLAVDIGIPSVLVVFAIINGVKRDVDTVVSTDAKIHLFGTMAGG